MVLVFPAIYADVYLHPYQYIYYNSLVGGAKGAFRNFELDYWGTSYREAALYINQVAPANSTVLVGDPVGVFWDYARPDLHLTSFRDINLNVHYDYVIIDTQNNFDTTVCQSIGRIKSITGGGALLTIIKSPPLSVKGCP